MSSKPVRMARLWWGLLCVLIPLGCAATFSPGSAREISRDRLLRISEMGKSDHLTYMGSDLSYHYVFDSRPGKERTYKVRVSDLKLANTFSIGEESYVLLPWVIEGQLMGSKPGDLAAANPGSESADQAHGTDGGDAKSESVSGVGRAAQPVVERSAQADFGKRLGDDQIETGRVQTP